MLRQGLVLLVLTFSMAIVNSLLTAPMRSILRSPGPSYSSAAAAAQLLQTAAQQRQQQQQLGGSRAFGKRRVRSPKRTRAKAATMAAEGAAVRVRFAPSPTGSLHVGGARTALFNWLKARQSGGTFVVRIEDTDQARSTRESEESMLADLRWLGLDWDEGPGVDGDYGPYRQSERGDIYKEYAQKLLESGHAYPCFCTEEELEAKRAAAEEAGEAVMYDGAWRDADPEVVAEKLASGEPHTVRFKVQPGAKVTIDDTVRGTVSWDAEKTVGDFILLRSNGVPVYNFCVAVDDATMKITHVIRAEEHLTNTLRQGLILEALEFGMPQYAHASLILGEDRSKLSKRHGATSVDQFKQQVSGASMEIENRKKRHLLSRVGFPWVGDCSSL
jgi:glutamyl-tRNA synthetase